jgi:2-polyprenyl-3-methyl-5-hydroxy-6-metoxy-1,4-benzoquinol methylase
METHFDSIWENEIYGDGKNIARYPYDVILSFIYRNFPRNKPRNEIKILEVGCGTGNNLWFAAREGF